MDLVLLDTSWIHTYLQGYNVCMCTFVCIHVCGCVCVLDVCVGCVCTCFVTCDPGKHVRCVWAIVTRTHPTVKNPVNVKTHHNDLCECEFCSMCVCACVHVCVCAVYTIMPTQTHTHMWVRVCACVCLNA